MRVFLKKRGSIEQMQYWHIVNLLFFAIILFMFLAFINDLGDSTFFQRHYLAKDMSLTINSLFLSSEDIRIDYPDRIDNLKVEVSKDDIVVDLIPSIELLQLSKYRLYGVNGVILESFIYPAESGEKDDSKVSEYLYEIEIEKDDERVRIHAEDIN